MNEMLKIVVSLSLSGSLLILVLLLCRPLFKNRFSRCWQYYIWLVVVARLLLPITPAASPIGALFQAADQAIVQTDAAPASGGNLAPAPQSGNDTAVQNGTRPQSGGPPAGTPPTEQRLVAVLKQNLWLIWLAGALILLIRKITVYQGFVKYIKAGRAEVSDTALLDRLAMLGERAGVKRPVELYTNGLISSPLLLGFFRPCIVLPSADLAPDDFTYTILHELTHYRRRDMFYKWLVQLTICLHWFNPLVHVMGREVGRACELACDEAVIRMLDPQGRRAYGDTLIHAIGAGGSYKSSLASVTLNESKSLLKERLEAIMIYQKKTKRMLMTSVALTILLAFGATAIGAYAAEAPGAQAGTVEAGSAGDRVIREGNVYYILCDGAGEGDRPASGVSEGSISFVLVRKDGYTAIGPFDDDSTLCDEVMAQCAYMLNAKTITQEDVMRILDAAANIQSGNTEGYKQEPTQDDAYATWNIVKEDGAYYYQNERVRILMDVKEDRSFSNFHYDRQGAIDLRLIRGHNGEIEKIESLTPAEAKEILSE